MNIAFLCLQYFIKYLLGHILIICSPSGEVWTHFTCSNPPETHKHSDFAETKMCSDSQPKSAVLLFIDED